MIVRTPEERAGIIEAGKRLGAVLEQLAAAAKPGVSTLELDALAEKLIKENSDNTSLKGYKPEGARRPYPATLCVSINDEVVHGIPSAERILKQGDIVGLDLVLDHQGYFVDSALTVAVGTISPKAHELIGVTQAALAAGIEMARPGNRIGDISHAIDSMAKDGGFAVVRLLGGHGVGHSVHEEPFIPNAGHPGTGTEILPGMVFAIEPIVNQGKASVILGPDGYTYRTRDGLLSAHFEHTVLVEEEQTLILTRRSSEK